MSRTDLDPATLAASLRRMVGDGSVEWVTEPMQTRVLLDVADMLDENAKLRELAAKNWNERAERSAEVVGIEDGYGGFDYCCSNCREALPECIEDAWDEYQADPARVDKPVEHCPFCGARFVDERG